MAVYSMTGYANASESAERTGEIGAYAEATSGRVDVDIRSVNARFLDLAFRLPDELRSLEPALRELVVGALRRGKVELRVQLADDVADGLPSPDDDRLLHLQRVETTVRRRFPEARGLSVDEVLHWCRGSSGERQPPDEASVLRMARAALTDLRSARAREGDRLADVLRERLAALRSCADRAEPLVPQAVRLQQQRFLDRWRDALAGAQVPVAASIDTAARDARALDEAAAYAVRIDIAEELARLRAHLDEFARLLDAGGELGKRLDFLTQELLREANTLASKASGVELTGIAVEMKVAIEQIREQVQNVE